ncbi:hypothetical protein HS5_11000 [Acidianus sp. HS-5]|nr:hypothetical protein HS5_11000 [Acidianus sp. HS-5]
MSVQTFKNSVNSPVNGEISQKDLLFLIESLTKEDREKIFNKFSSDFKGVLSRSAMYKLSKGRTHLGNDRILWLIDNNPEAREFVFRLLKERAKKTLQILAVVGVDEDE